LTASIKESRSPAPRRDDHLRRLDRQRADKPPHGGRSKASQGATRLFHGALVEGPLPKGLRSIDACAIAGVEARKTAAASRYFFIAISHSLLAGILRPGHGVTRCRSNGRLSGCRTQGEFLRLLDEAMDRRAVDAAQLVNRRAFGVGRKW
jgi:hypothetical protein